MRTLYNRQIGLLKRELRFFRGTLPPQRSARRENCLSAVRREFFPGSAARRSRVEKMF